jgi:hypothetical protein
MREKYSAVKESLVNDNSEISMLEYRTGKQNVLAELGTRAKVWWEELPEEEKKNLVKENS